MMKKRLQAIILASVMGVSSMFVLPSVSSAEEVESRPVELSYLMTEEALIGHMEATTYGIYLANGFSVINKAGTGLIGVGATTNAAKLCTVSVNAIVERLVSGSWYRVTNFPATRYNDLSVMVGAEVSVGTGYSYRTRGVHSANSDVGYSYTDALKM